MGTVSSYLSFTDETPKIIDESTRNDHILWDKGINFMVQCNLYGCLENIGIIPEIWIIIIDFMMRIKVDDIVRDALIHGWSISNGYRVNPPSAMSFIYHGCSHIDMDIFHYSMPHYLFIRPVRRNLECKKPSYTKVLREYIPELYGLNKYSHLTQFGSYYLQMKDVT